MADVKKKEEVTPFFTTEKVTLYAPAGAAHHAEGEKTEVQALQKEKFLSLGYTETLPAPKKAKAEKTEVK